MYIFLWIHFFFTYFRKILKTPHSICLFPLPPHTHYLPSFSTKQFLHNSFNIVFLKHIWNKIFSFLTECIVKLINLIFSYNSPSFVILFCILFTPMESFVSHVVFRFNYFIHYGMNYFQSVLLSVVTAIIENVWTSIHTPWMFSFNLLYICNCDGCFQKYDISYII